MRKVKALILMDECTNEFSLNISLSELVLMEVVFSPGTVFDNPQSDHLNIIRTYTPPSSFCLKEWFGEIQ